MERRPITRSKTAAKLLKNSRMERRPITRSKTLLLNFLLKLFSGQTIRYNITKC